MRKKMPTKVQKTLCIAVETSGRAGSIAIGQGHEILAEMRFSGLLRHSIELLTGAEKLLTSIGKKPEDLGQINCVIGPGSFTGLRISVTMAKMLSMATGAKIVGVKTSDALAENASDYMEDTSAQLQRIATVIDAKRGAFFVAIFEKQGGQWVKTTQDQLLKAAEFVEKCENFANNEKIWLLGEGLVYYKEDFAGKNINFLPEDYWQGRAKNIFKVGQRQADAGEFTDPVDLAPFYLRGADAKPKKGMKKPD
jgi:tRNA threonylcarbamoyladenosine biosynthesis protein TsaB